MANTYMVTDPRSGVTLELEGDSPPTESELLDLFKDYAPVESKPTPTWGERISERFGGAEARVNTLQKERPGLLPEFGRRLLKDAYRGHSDFGALMRNVALRGPFGALSPMTALTGAGAAAQGMEAGIQNAMEAGGIIPNISQPFSVGGIFNQAAPGLGLLAQVARPEVIKTIASMDARKIWDSLRGRAKAEYGDTLLKMGAPELLAQLGGLAVSMGMPETQLVGIGTHLFDRGASAVAQSSAGKGAKKLAMEHIGRIDEPKVIMHLLDTDFRVVRDLGKKLWTNYADTASELANTIVNRARRYIYKPARRAWQNVSAETAGKTVDAATNTAVVGSVDEVLKGLRSSGNDALADKILDTPIKRVVREVGDQVTEKTKHVMKPAYIIDEQGRVVKVVQAQRTTGKKIIQGGETKASDLVENFNPKTGDWIPAKATEARVTKNVTSKVKEVTTVRDMLNDAGNGVPMTVGDWLNFKRTLADTMGDSVPAANVVRAVGDTLQGRYKELELASGLWRDWLTFLDRQESIIGKVVKRGINNEKEIAGTPAALLDYLSKDTGAAGPYATAVDDVTNLLSKHTGTKMGNELLDQIKDVSAASFMASKPTKITATTIIGGLGTLGAGVMFGQLPPSAAIAGALGIITEATPYLSALSGRAIYGSSAKVLKKPLGKALAQIMEPGYAINNIYKDPNMLLRQRLLMQGIGMGQATAGTGMLRELTGRNQ